MTLKRNDMLLFERFKMSLYGLYIWLRAGHLAMARGIHCQGVSGRTATK